MAIVVDSIDLYAALAEMKDITAAGGTFAMKFRKWDSQRRRGGDLVTINAARLRPKARDEAVAHSSYKIFFTDTETGRAMNCWQILLVEMNGRRTILN